MITSATPFSVSGVSCHRDIKRQNGHVKYNTIKHSTLEPHQNLFTELNPDLNAKRSLSIFIKTSVNEIRNIRVASATEINQNSNGNDVILLGLYNSIIFI